MNVGNAIFSIFQFWLGRKCPGGPGVHQAKYQPGTCIGSKGWVSSWAALGVLEFEGDCPSSLFSTDQATAGMLGPGQGSPVQARHGPKEVMASLHGSRETWGNLTLQCHIWLCWLKSSLYLMADQLSMYRKTKGEQNMPPSQVSKASCLSSSDFEQAL